MENNKLKKLGKYFTKGLLTGVLATALMAGTAGCSQPAGGNGDSDDQYEKTGPHQFVAVADICGEEHKCKVNGCTEHGYTHPAYMNVKGDFGGQRFVESDADWYSDNTKFTERYKDANKYIDCKVAELQKLWEDENTYSPLSTQIGTALKNFDKGVSLNQRITSHYDALAPVFASMAKTMKNVNGSIHPFNATYHKLAARAYNQSLGVYKNSTGYKSNMEMENMQENFFVDELDKAGLEYNELTDSHAKNLMNQYLSTIAYSTDTNQSIIKKVVELALVNESLYGLNDYAEKTNVSGQFFAPERSLDTFYTKIGDEYKSINYSLNDRTM